MAVTDEVQGAVGVIYGRYSADPTQTDQSLEGQLRDCYAYAKSHGIRVIHEYLDRHISGKEAESRPQFQQMITDSKKKKFDVVLVWKRTGSHGTAMTAPGTKRR